MDQQLHKLLQIKRYEHPSADYFERFLDEVWYGSVFTILLPISRFRVWLMRAWPLPR